MYQLHLATPSQTTTIHALPWELSNNILRNLSPLDAFQAKATCRLWKNTVEHLQALWTNMSLYGRLDLRNIIYVAINTILHRKDSDDDETIAQLCLDAAEIYQLPESQNLLKRPMISSARIIVGIGMELLGYQDFINIEILSVMAQNNPYSFLIKGLNQFRTSRDKALLTQASEELPIATVILNSSIQSENLQVKKAAKQKCSFACMILADYYSTSNPKKSSKYVNIAADVGNKFAKYLVAKDLIITDPKKAILWLKEASLRGIIPAQFLLGKLHEEQLPGAEEAILELQMSGIPFTHVENGQFFRRHNDTLSPEQHSIINDFTVMKSVTEYLSLLSKLELIKDKILKDNTHPDRNSQHA